MRKVTCSDRSLYSHVHRRRHNIGEPTHQFGYGRHGRVQLQIKETLPEHVIYESRVDWEGKQCLLRIGLKPRE